MCSEIIFTKNKKVLRILNCSDMNINIYFFVVSSFVLIFQHYNEQLLFRQLGCVFFPPLVMWNNSHHAGKGKKREQEKKKKENKKANKEFKFKV